MEFEMSCPIRDCEGVLTVEVTGKYRPARHLEPPEYPEVEILAATCGHEDVQDRDSDDLALAVASDLAER